MRCLFILVRCAIVTAVVLDMRVAVTQSASHLATVPTPASLTFSPAVGLEVLQGRLAIVWGDPQLGKPVSSQTLFFLTDKQGDRYALRFDGSLLLGLADLLSLNGEEVSITGTVDLLSVPGGNTRTVQVESLQALTPVAPSKELIGPQPWVSILCKFPDIAGEPKPPAYFQGMYSAEYPGLDHYFTEISYHAITLNGSIATTVWYTLPHPRSYYVYDADGDGDVELDYARSAVDCTAVSDPEIYYPDFVGINLMFNGDLDGAAWGGGYSLTLDGATRYYSMTWEPPWGYSSITVMSHEMGHGFGWPHSSPDNQWDIMSDGWNNCDRVMHPVYGCVAQDTIAFHLSLKGWIPHDQQAQVGPENSATLTLEQLDLPQTNSILLARVPIQGSGRHFYTVEARRRVGYDYKLPGEGVIIHEVDIDQQVPATVVDIDGNGNTGDAGAIWSVGESFVDATNAITITVAQFTGTGWVVSISNPLSAEPQMPPYEWLDLPFENTLNGTQGEIAHASGVTFSPGHSGQGALIDQSDILWYEAEGNVNQSAGAVKFWLKPNWNGGDPTSYPLFGVGNWFYNGIFMMKDNLGGFTLLVWSSTSQFFMITTTNVSHWRANEWHKVVMTWNENRIALFLDGLLVVHQDDIQLPDSPLDRIYIGSGLSGVRAANAVIDDFVVYADEVPRQNTYLPLIRRQN